MEEIKKIFGIDLGTTYSCISYVDENGKAVPITNIEGDRITPSVVYYEEEDSIIVGKEAKNMLAAEPDKVAVFIKREMGKDDFLFNGDNPQKISAHILRKIVQDASEALYTEINDVVITCPAYFGDREKKATKAAGEIAGLNVVSVLNEPTAAAISYGVNVDDDQIILVYDLGGGTFDITMIEVKEKEIKVIASGGNHQLGGMDWDNALMEYCAGEFENLTGVNDILQNNETKGDLQVKVEEAKKSLTGRKKAKIRVIHEGIAEVIEVTQEQFEEITESLLNQTISLTHEMMNEAKEKGAKYSSFDKILLVGGSSKMPQIKRKVDAEFGIESRLFEPDEAVAKGAALYANNQALKAAVIKELIELGVNNEDIATDSQERQEAITNVAVKSGISVEEITNSVETKIINATSKSYGTQYGEEPNLMVKQLILKNTDLPVSAKETFVTSVDAQTGVANDIYESDFSDIDIPEKNAIKLDGQNLIFDKPYPQGTPIEVEFLLNEDGMLDVKAYGGGSTLNFQLKVMGVMSREEIEAAKIDVLSKTVS